MKKLLLVFALFTLFSCGNDEVQSDKERMGCFTAIQVSTGKRVYLGCISSWNNASGSRLNPAHWYDNKVYTSRTWTATDNCDECK